MLENQREWRYCDSRYIKYIITDKSLCIFWLEENVFFNV